MSSDCKPLLPGCTICSSQIGLLKCRRCMVVQYCGKEHQSAHWNSHRKACARVKKAHDSTDKEEVELRALDSLEYMMPENVFVQGEGMFWGILATRGYMRARFALAAALIKVNTFLAVEAAYDHLRDMLRLCRSDNMGVRDLVPGLLLRLGRDQECYDFCKWWRQTDCNSSFNYGDMNGPYLNLKGEDVFEDVSLYCGKYADVAQTVAITLIKIRMLLDIQDLRNSAALYGKGGQQLIDHTRSFRPRSSIISGDKTLLEGDVQKERVKLLQAQITELFKSVVKTNKHFWQLLVDYKQHVGSMPRGYMIGSIEEAQLRLNDSVDSWLETPGALQYIGHLRSEH